MTAQEYIQAQLQNSAHYQLTEQDQTLLTAKGIEAFIYNKLTSKKFRKWSLDESSAAQITGAIERSVVAGKPIQFRYPFGGYKLWSMPGSPTVDWAEFFAVAYYLQYVAPVAAAYIPGIELIFASDDVIIERMDNVPVADTDAYFNSFKQLLAQFEPYLTSNIAVDIIRIGDLYPDKQVMEQELAANVERVSQAYATIDQDAKQPMLTTSALNIQWQGAKDLTELSEADRQAITAMGPIYHDAYCALQKRRDFNRSPDKIVLFTTVISNAIAIGTTKSSVTKFWTGYGILERHADSFKSRILSPKQLAELSGIPKESIKITLFDAPNFKAILVV